MNWHYVENGQSTGPVTEEKLAELALAGKINASTLVWREGLAQWVTYSSISSLTGATAPGGAFMAACAECGKFFPVDEMIKYGAAHVCASCKPVFMQKIAEGAQINTGTFRYAGFWIRVAAKILDGLILGIPCGVVVAIFVMMTLRGGRSAPVVPPFWMNFIQIPFILLNGAYQIFFIGKYGATLGKMACKLKVITGDGRPPGYGIATGRYFSEILSVLICYIGYIMIGFDSEKRGLHDRICNTRVIYK